jgi:hypothetical protein
MIQSTVNTFANRDIMVNFSQLTSPAANTAVIEPRDVFQSLPKKDKYEFVRAVQSEVWGAWFNRRNESNLVIKLNTGGGKTVVGLCILKSCLNERHGPAVYLVPDKFLVEQVSSEADCLGIKTTTDPRDSLFQRGESILVCTIDKLVNGRSVFGVNEKVIEIGSLIVDDAHACVARINEKFTLEIKASTETYNKLFSLFKTSLTSQSESQVIDIEQGDQRARLKVPYWEWQERKSEILQILGRSKDDQLQWVYPLLKENIMLCDCIVSGQKIEISSKMIPIDVIPAFSEAKRKIFMTATLSDDSILSSHFGVPEPDIRSPITPDKADDMGERMIIEPQDILPTIEDREIKQMCVDLAQGRNVVVIVPSAKRAEYWADVAGQTLDKNNIEDGIEKLKNNPAIGITVLINRYDGIDLPGDACRLLVIDGLPSFMSLSERTTQLELKDCTHGHRDLIHKVEQGMGRGVRSPNDHCAVILMGIDLISMLHNGKAIEYFSAGTKKQIEISAILTAQIRSDDKSIDGIKDTIESCLNRDEGWIEYAKSSMVGLKYDTQGKVNEVTSIIRRAYDLFSSGLTQDAAKEMNKLSGVSRDDKNYQAHLNQLIAQFKNPVDPVSAQKLQVSAKRENKYLLTPIQGIDRKAPTRELKEQANNSSEHISKNFKNGNEFSIRVQKVVSDLNWEVDYKEFEAALAEAGRILGYDVAEPDLETGTGPDVFWYLGSDWSLVIECKNMAVSGLIPKKSVNQLSGHMNWHDEHYPRCQGAIPMIIHQSNQLCEKATAPQGTRIMDRDTLEGFKKAFLGFAEQLVVGEKYLISSMITPVIKAMNFGPDTIINKYFKKLK